MSKCECADERAEQGASLLAEMRKVFRKHKSLTEHEVMRSITEGEGEVHEQRATKKVSGGDALMGHTRSHPEHEG